MDTTIYYFSSTGNSLDVAKVITKELEGTLLPMTKHIGGQCDSQNIGFIFPTYFWGLPHLVEDFISKLIITKDNPYIFGIMLAKASGGGLGSLALSLNQKGLQLDYGKTIHSVSNYIVSYDIDMNTVDKITESAREQAVFCAKEIRLQKQNHNRKIPVLTDRFHQFYLSAIGAGDKKFTVTNECIGCGVCEKVCPVKNIQIEDGKPCFQHHCEHCIACMHWCPKQAIQYGEKTKKRQRYHNPNVKREELNK